MYADAIRKVLENIISGVILEGESNHLKATRNFLCSGFTTSTTVEKDFEHQSSIKEEQAKQIRIYIEDSGLL